MKTYRSILMTLAGLTLAGALTAAPATSAAPAATVTKENYPLTTCVVSDEKLGSMGEPIEYVHRQAGQPDRVVLLCCKSCVKSFKKDPAKYLQKLDAAAQAGSKAGAAAQKKDPHAGHAHE